MGVGTYSLVTSDAARVYAGNTGQKDAFWIYCNSPSGSTAATCEVTATGISLVVTSGASAGTDTITFAAKPTLTELIAAINALVKPAGTFTWKAGLVYYGASPSAYLPMTGAMACLGSANQIRIQTETTYETDSLADKATDFIERWAGRKFKTRSYDRQQYIGNGREMLALNQYPVTRVYRVSEGETNAFSVTNTTAKNFATVEVTSTKVRLNADGVVTDITLATYATITLLIAAINGTSGWSATEIAEGARCPYYTGSDGTTKVAELIPMPARRCISPSVAYVEVPADEVDDYWIMAGGGDEDRDAGMLMREGGWTQGETFYIDSVCGYTTIPAALEDLCLALVKLKYDRAKMDANMRSESLGDYSYSTADLRQVSEDLLNGASFFKAVTL